MKLLLASTFEILGNKIDTILDQDLSCLSVICIPTAAYAEDNYEEWLEPEMAQIRERVQKFKLYDIAGKTQREVQDAVKDFDMIYVTGGNTFYLLEQMQNCNFKEIVKMHFQKGGTYFGSSAGAIVTGPRIDFIKELDDETKANLTSYQGLDFVDFLFMPHIDNPKFSVGAEKIMREIKNEKIIGLRDDQAIKIDGNIIKIY